MTQAIPFSINRISAPRIPFADFAAMTKRLGVAAIEIRNDLPEAEMVNGAKAADIGAAAKTHKPRSEGFFEGVKRFFDDLTR